jgi:sarcosine oxidase
MKRSYDFIVIGCGGLGSAALYWLSRQAGNEVLGIEQFHLGHSNGASQDHSRIIRLSYDDPRYCALTPYNYIAWREVEAESGLQLVHRTGGVIFSQPDSSGNYMVDAYAQAMRQTGIPFEQLSPVTLSQRFPQFHLHAEDRALYQSSDGLVDPSQATAAHASLARRRGATIIEETAVQALRPTGDGVEVQTSAGVFHARRLVLASGAWTNKILQSLGVHLPLTVTEEQVTYFATPDLREFMPDRFPIWIFYGEDCFYGLPVYGEAGIKAGQDLGGDVVTVDTRKFQPNPRPLAKLQAFLAEYIPGAIGPILYTKPCLYTMPPDRGFILDTLPGFPHISVAIGAGHAFKFASLIGLILSHLAIDGKTPYPISAFSLDRPAICDPAYQWLVPRSANS